MNTSRSSRAAMCSSSVTAAAADSGASGRVPMAKHYRKFMRAAAPTELSGNQPLFNSQKLMNSFSSTESAAACSPLPSSSRWGCSAAQPQRQDPASPAERPHRRELRDHDTPDTWQRQRRTAFSVQARCRRDAAWRQVISETTDSETRRAERGVGLMARSEPVSTIKVSLRARGVVRLYATWARCWTMRGSRPASRSSACSTTL
jgi:hypothetical protein